MTEAERLLTEAIRLGDQQADQLADLSLRVRRLESAIDTALSLISCGRISIAADVLNRVMKR